jgi:predicted transcriptional regulator
MKDKLSKTTKVVLKLIMDAQVPIKSDDLVTNLNFNLRTVRYALKTLCDSHLIERIPNLTDLRSYYYRPSDNANYSLI